LNGHVLGIFGKKIKRIWKALTRWMEKTRKVKGGQATKKGFAKLILWEEKKYGAS
jgi:hypothetical protein